MKRLTHKARYEAGYKLNKDVHEWQAVDSLAAYENTGLTPKEIMDGKLLAGWIPVSEQLPKEPPEGLTDLDDLPEYIVMIAGAEVPTTLQYAGDGEWYWDGDFYSVIAWMPLPEPYKPE